jgi:hypothetical protein
MNLNYRAVYMTVSNRVFVVVLLLTCLPILGNTIGLSHAGFFYNPLKDELDTKKIHQFVPSADLMMGFSVYTNSLSDRYTYNALIDGYAELYRYDNRLSFSFIGESELIANKFGNDYSWLNGFNPRGITWTLGLIANLKTKIGYWQFGWSHYCKHNIDSVDNQLDRIIREQERPEGMEIPAAWLNGEWVREGSLNLERVIVFDSPRIKYLTKRFTLWMVEPLGMRIQGVLSMDWYLWRSDWYVQDYKFLITYGFDWTALLVEPVGELYVIYMGNLVLKGARARFDFRVNHASHDEYLESGFRFRGEYGFFVLYMLYEGLEDMFIEQVAREEKLWRLGLKVQTFY